MIIRKRAYPRAGLIGNPSDGYFGKTISLTFRNFRAEVVLYETPELEILPSSRDHSVFTGVKSLVSDVRLFGYYGGIRLLKATVKRLHDYCRENGIELHERNFTIRYRSDIPHMVGLAGSSAIITACMRSLTAFYGISIPKPEQANLILSVECDELGISAGLQDRVAQVYQGLVYMDFAEEIMEAQGHGKYEELDPSLLPPLYIGYTADLSEVSEVPHNNLREKYARRDPDMLAAIASWADLSEKAKACLLERKPAAIGELLDSNFDLRAGVSTISQGNIDMVEAARAVGASAKFTGSGGAIIGTYTDESMFEDLVNKLRPMGIQVIRPDIVPPTGDCEE